jgi:hypothetical protein
MEKIKLTIEEIIEASQAISALLQMPGIEPRKTYWLDRNNKKLISVIKRWEPTHRGIFLAHCSEVPASPFVPPNTYSKFKEELIFLFSFPTELDDDGEALNNLFIKYETTSEYAGQKVIPIENMKAYTEEIDQNSKEFNESIKEVEFTKIVVDQMFSMALSRISGKVQLAISFMLEIEDEPSNIIIPSKGGRPTLVQ